MKRTIIDASQLELEDNVVTIKRVTKVVKGGRNMKFTALVVVGDKNGHVGVGLGKATEIPEAIRKGKEDAIKKLVEVPIDENGSVPELAGYKNIRTKSLGSNNKQNVVLAAVNGLSNLKRPEDVAKARGISLEELLG